MAWYRAGTVAVTNGSTTVTGTGTAFVGNVEAGESFVGPDGRPYEIASVNSDTQLTLGQTYQGGNSSGQTYAILPTQSFIYDLATEAAELIASFAAVRDGIGQGLVADGTVSAPGLRYAGDTDTGFYRPTTNALGFVTAGVERARLTAGGRFGLKTSTPNYDFDLRGQAGIELYNGTGGGDVLNFRPSLGDASKYNLSISSYDHSGGGVGPADGLSINGNDGVSIATGSSSMRQERMRVDGLGRVGIGTSNPGANCEIAGSSGGAELRLRSTDAGVAQMRAYVNGAEAGKVSFDGSNVSIETTGSERLRIEGDGTNRPGADNTQTLGSASYRWSTVYAGTGTINTSDEREKTWRGPVSDAEYRAGLAVIDELGFFQWNDSIDDKGEDEARIHLGVRAQAVWAAFAGEDLVAPIGNDGKPGNTSYAFLCWDEWDELTEPVLEMATKTRQVESFSSTIIDPSTGAPAVTLVTEEYEELVDTGETRVVREAGHRYGVRPDQLALFLIAVQAKRQAAIETRLDALEAA